VGQSVTGQVDVVDTHMRPDENRGGSGTGTEDLEDLGRKELELFDFIVPSFRLPTRVIEWVAGQAVS